MTTSQPRPTHLPSAARSWTNGIKLRDCAFNGLIKTQAGRPMAHRLWGDYRAMSSTLGFLLRSFLCPSPDLSPKSCSIANFRGEENSQICAYGEIFAKLTTLGFQRCIAPSSFLFLFLKKEIVKKTPLHCNYFSILNSLYKTSRDNH